MPRHELTPEDRSRGGKTRAAQPSFIEACRKGFEATCAHHPYFVRKHLPKWISAIPTISRSRSEIMKNKITIRVWHCMEWKTATVVKPMHDTVHVIEPGTEGVVWIVPRIDINPLDLSLVPLPFCRIKWFDEQYHAKWEWVPVVAINDESITVQKDGEQWDASRTEIHPEDNRLMPPPAKIT